MTNKLKTNLHMYAKTYKKTRQKQKGAIILLRLDKTYFCLTQEEEEAWLS